MATRKNGKPGSIFLDHSKNKWHGRVYDGFHDNGSYKCKNFYGKSKAEVERKIDAYEKNKEKRKGLVDSDDTLDDRMYQVNKLEYHSNCISASSYQRREYTRKAFSQFSLSRIPIPLITRKDVEKFSQEVAYVYSNSVIHKMWQMANDILKQAVYDGIIAKNPMDPSSGIICPKSYKKDKTVMPLSIEAQKKLHMLLCDSLQSYNPQEDIHKNNYATQILLACFTGMRIGEINALSPDDIDFENRKIYVRYTVARGEEYKTYIGPTKTKAGNRIVIMDDYTYEILKYYVENIYPFKPQKVVMKAFDGTDRTLLFSAYKKNTNQYSCVTSSQCNDQFKRMCKKHGIESENLCIHALRHTYATRCVESGISPYELQYRLGHSDIKVTMNTYFAMSLDKQETSLQQVTSYFEEQNLGLDLNSSKDES